MRNRFLLAAAWLSFLALPTQAAEPEPPAPITAEMQRMTGALAQGDFAAFLANGTDEAKARLTRERFEAVAGPIGPRFKAGFDAAYLTRLNQQGCEVYLWKATFRDGGDDYLVRLVMEKGRVAGFWIQ